MASTNPTADISIVPTADLGRLAALGEAQPVPESLKSSENPFGWMRLLSIYTDRLAGWGGISYGVPIGGEGYVLAYRTDRIGDPALSAEFQAKYHRKLAPPVTWEDLAEQAEWFASRGQKPLPAKPVDTLASLREFHFMAACYDRLSVTTTSLLAMQKDPNAKPPSTDRLLSFFHDTQTGRSRLGTAGFRAAAAMSRRLDAARGPETDAAVGLAKGTATFAVLSLAELGRLPKDATGAVPANIGLAALPGTRVWYDPVTGQSQPPADKTLNINFVPCYGMGGWVGVVSAKSENGEAAFDLLSDWASSTRSAELLSDPALGFGPFRTEHLDVSRDALWSRYGFDAERIRQLVEALRAHSGVALANPTYTLRGPTATADLQTLATNLSGPASADDAITMTLKTWEMNDAGRNAEELKTERRRAAGFR